jgi:hypothetical protein
MGKEMKTVDMYRESKKLLGVSNKQASLVFYFKG